MNSSGETPTTVELEQIKGSEIADLLAAVHGGERLSRADCLRLWQTQDLTGLGILANLRRESLSGHATFFRPALHVNPTRRPVPACSLCDRWSAAGASPLTQQEMERVLDGIDSSAVGELHLAGGPECRLGISDLAGWVRLSRARRPNLKLRAFTWDLLERAAEKETKTPAQALGTLLDSGLTSLAGGALVDLTPERRHLGSNSVEEMKRRVTWVEAAANLGLKCELSWIFGDGDKAEVLLDTLQGIRELQDRCGVFECFTPLLFQSATQDLDIPIPTGYNQLRAIAVGRLFLDNIPRISAPWAGSSESIMQIAQWYGADDAGCALLPVRESQTGRPDDIGRERLQELIAATGREPVNLLAGGRNV